MPDPSHPHDVERSDVDPRLVAAIALGASAFLIAAPFLVLAGYPDASRLGRIREALRPPAPRLQVFPRGDLTRLRANEDAQLQSFGWVDRGQQVARMPIDRAMQLLAERGRSGWPSVSTKPAQP
jgi:hypothetical protein